MALQAKDITAILKKQIEEFEAPLEAIDVGSVIEVGDGIARADGLAGVMAGPILAVEAGMGESILILTFVVIVIGGIGSIRGALIAALLVGMVDTLGRAFLPGLFRLFLPLAEADGVAASLASMSVYILMALILIWRPKGLLPAHV